MTKRTPINLLTNLRSLLVQQWKFEEGWKNDQLIFQLRKGMLESRITTPILGKNENDMLLDSKKLINFSIHHLGDENLIYQIKNTHVREGWLFYAQERVRASITIIDNIEKCQNCEKDYPFPGFIKTTPAKGRSVSSIETKCPTCGVIAPFKSGRVLRALEIECCKLSVGY